MTKNIFFKIVCLLTGLFLVTNLVLIIHFIKLVTLL